jgi:hypothetical protein
LLILAGMTNCEMRHKILKSTAQKHRTLATFPGEKVLTYSNGGRRQLVTNSSSARRSS